MNSEDTRVFVEFPIERCLVRLSVAFIFVIAVNDIEMAVVSTSFVSSAYNCR